MHIECCITQDSLDYICLIILIQTSLVEGGGNLVAVIIQTSEGS